jgi:hypothetical protein
VGQNKALNQLKKVAIIGHKEAKLIHQRETIFERYQEIK